MADERWFYLPRMTQELQKIFCHQSFEDLSRERRAETKGFLVFKLNIQQLFFAAHDTLQVNNPEFEVLVLFKRRILNVHRCYFADRSWMWCSSE